MCEEDPDLEDDPYMREYWEKRLAELKMEVAKPKWGYLLEIAKNQFELEVTRAPEEAIVLIHLY